MLPSSSDTSEITVSALHALQTSDAKNPLLIDCREPDEHAICKISDSVLIPLSTFATNAEGQLPDKERPIVVYCHHGMRSLRATEFLRRKGYERSFSLEGGIDGWAVEIEPAMTRY